MCIVERIVLKTVLETGTSGALFIAEVIIFLSLFKTTLFSLFPCRRAPPPQTSPFFLFSTSVTHSIMPLNHELTQRKVS